MEAAVKERQLCIGGMTCISCQNRIEKKLKNTAGIKSVRVSYSEGIADIVYDTDIIKLKDIKAIIQNLDYTVLQERKEKSGSTKRVIGLLIIIASFYLLLQQFGILNLLVPSRLAEVDMGYGMLFFIGLLTSVHCVAMCGGINLSQCIPQNKIQKGRREAFSTFRPAFLYNLGRVVSYTVVGFIVGGLGSVVTFSSTMQGMLKLIAGIFMVIMGINTLGIFPILRRITPRLPVFFSKQIDKRKAGSRSPLFVGLLNGLMPCGPLQSMQIYALSTGSPIAGAFSMLLFSLGTVPLMFGVGAASSLLGKKFSKKIMTAGAVLVVVLGMSMFSQGWGLTGWALPLTDGLIANSAAAESSVKIEDGVQIVNSTLLPGKYPAITVQEGVPVKWIIDAPQGSINGCNNRMLIPEYNIEHQFKEGENIIEFTPSKTGRFPFSCWMGMIRSAIKVVEAGTDVSQEDASYEEEQLAGGVAEEAAVSDYVIPTDEIVVASQTGEYQTIKMKMTERGFQPAVMVVQADLETEWIVENGTSGANSTDLLVPDYASKVSLVSGENSLFLYPVGDFDFSNGESTLFGYIKVVEDINEVDIEEIKKEVSDFRPLIWPSETFGAAGGAPSCH